MTCRRVFIPLSPGQLAVLSSFPALPVLHLYFQGSQSKSTHHITSAPFSYAGLGHFVLILHWLLRLRVTLTIFASFPCEDLGPTQRVIRVDGGEPHSPLRISAVQALPDITTLTGYCTGLPESPWEGLPSAPGLPHSCHSTLSDFLHSTLLGLSCMFICLFHL